MHISRCPFRLFGWVCFGALSIACDSSSKSVETSPENAQAGMVPVARSSSTKPAKTVATIGKTAPEFVLPDLDGRTVRLSDFKGKTVVLEWFNPKCPFVRLSHTKGSLAGAAERHAQSGVVWLAINSSAPGKQGHGNDVNRQAVAEFAMRHPLLVDAQGTAGRAYGAERTPHMFVINPEGRLVYAGAIDNSPDGEGKTPEGGMLVRYVDQALAELAEGKAISVPRTKAYGCTVKYGT